jgi:hypothetical protein
MPRNRGRRPRPFSALPAASGRSVRNDSIARRCGIRCSGRTAETVLCRADRGKRSSLRPYVAAATNRLLQRN